MTWEIALIFVLLGLALASFIWERIPADLTAMALFAILLATELLDHDGALAVFSNPAPVTVGAMFVLSAALEKCGAIEWIAARLTQLPKMPLPPVMIAMILPVALVSAFINNTPVVVVFTPVVFSLARRMEVAASKLLIPLSFASIFGGSCTLIGTSTNILVSGISQSSGLEPFSMFELAWVGVPVLIAGVAYLAIFGDRILPVRETLSSILSEEERREYLTEAFVQPDSSLLGKPLKDTPLSRRSGMRVLEVIRDGVAVKSDLRNLELEPGDRLVLACRRKGIAHARSLPGLDLVAEFGGGLEAISASEGMIVEGVVGPDSPVIGRTLDEINFRQRYRMVVLAVHRRGRNLREELGSVRFQFGDTLLLLGSEEAVRYLQRSDDIMVLDRPRVQATTRTEKLPLVLATIAAIVASAALGFVKIEIAAIVGCVFLFLTGCVTPKEGYQAIQWPILFIIFGMLGMGIAMETTGASAFLSRNLVELTGNIAPSGSEPIVLLMGVYLMTTILTELLSNNAAAVLMATLAIRLADTVGVAAEPFLIAVTMAASASFATPIGYQTNTYVYGIGGYRFTDFIRVGLPMNAIAFVVTCAVTPLVWKF